MKKVSFNYKSLIINLILFIMLSVGMIIFNYKNNDFINSKVALNVVKDNGLVWAQNHNLNKNQDQGIQNKAKDINKSKELRKKVRAHIAEKIENDQKFWNYLKANHSELYNSLNSLKSKYEKLYNHFSLKVYGIYKRIDQEENSLIKDLLKEKIAIHDKMVKLVLDYKEKKIQEKEFETNVKNYIKELLDNEEKILTEKLNEFKAKKDKMSDDIYKRIKMNVDKN